MEATKEGITVSIGHLGSDLKAIQVQAGDNLANILKENGIEVQKGQTVRLAGVPIENLEEATVTEDVIVLITRKITGG